MGIETLIKLMVSLIGEYLFKPKSAAKYAKWFLRMRDYLLLLFPVDVYPTDHTVILGQGMTNEKVAVPIEAVHEAAKSKGFSLPSILGKLIN